jgi:hypothetical protein
MKTPGPTGLAKSISATTLSHEGARMKITRLNTGGAGTTKEHLSLGHLGVMEAAVTMVAEATVAGVATIRKD